MDVYNSSGFKHKTLWIREIADTHRIQILLLNVKL